MSSRLSPVDSACLASSEPACLGGKLGGKRRRWRPVLGSLEAILHETGHVDMREVRGAMQGKAKGRQRRCDAMQHAVGNTGSPLAFSHEPVNASRACIRRFSQTSFELIGKEKCPWSGWQRYSSPDEQHHASDMSEAITTATTHGEDSPRVVMGVVI